MKEVCPNIFSIEERGKFLGISRPPENIYVFAGKNGIIYDAGYGDNKTVNYLVNEVKKIEKKFLEAGKEFNLTQIIPSHPHADHFSGLNQIANLLNIKKVLPKTIADVITNKSAYEKYYESDYFEDYLYSRNLKNRIKHGFIRIISDFLYNKFFGVRLVEDPVEIIEEKTQISINDEEWNIFPSPGHCFGHISLYNEKKGILFSGDNVLRSITTWLGPPDSNIDDYLTTLKELKQLPNLKIILPAHGSPIENPKERIDEILAHRQARTEKILELIRSNPNHGISPSKIIKSLYPDGGRGIRSIARGYVCLTLKKLERDGFIKRREGKNEIEFFPF